MEVEAFQKSFLNLLSLVESHSFLKELKLVSLFKTSFEMDRYPIQDASRYRSRLLALHISYFLIDERGDLNRQRLEALYEQLIKKSFLLGPFLEGETPLFSHVRDCLAQLRDDVLIGEFLRKFFPPLCHKKAEEIVRETLWPNQIGKIQAADIKRAILAAWLTPLRQIIGSCFATAPAILVQRDSPLIFFQDLYDLLSTGQMKRVYQGKEYSIPLSPSSGKGDLLNPIPSLDALEALALSPGIVTAFDEAETFPTTFSKEEKENQLRRLFSEIQEIPVNYEMLLRIGLMKALALSEEEIEEEEALKKIQMTAFFARRGEIYHEKLSEKGKKIAEFHRKFKKAKMAFRSMTECSLLRSWEYSMASFCDVKTEFARWNLFIGLGLHPDQKGGIGSFLYAFIDSQLQAMNAKAIHSQRDYEEAISHVRSLEALMHRSLSDAHRSQLKGELTGAVHAAETAIEIRDRAGDMADALAKSFSFLIQQFDERLQAEFQEIFDPALKLDEAAPCDDSPAGFRLVYKHGRRDASLWTLIYTEKEYLQALREFFPSIEVDLQLPPPLGREFISEVISAVLHFLDEGDFLASALARSRSQGRAAPWEYVSGGTMQVLVQNYWSRSLPLSEAVCHPKSERDFYHFLEEQARKTETPLLIHSPTHAFVFYPKWIGQQDRVDLEEVRRKIRGWELSPEMREFIAHQLSRRLPFIQRPLFFHLFLMKAADGDIAQFRGHLIECVDQIQMKNGVQEVDSILFEHFGLLSISEAKSALQDLLKPFIQTSFTAKWQGNFFRPKDLLLKAKEVLLENKRDPFSEVDWDRKLVERMRELGYGYPAPLFFADTNWSGWLFGWVLNVATCELELWRLNRTATSGFPMREWRSYFSPENSLPWILLSNPYEYSS